MIFFYDAKQLSVDLHFDIVIISTPQWGVLIFFSPALETRSGHPHNKHPWISLNLKFKVIKEEVDEDSPTS